MAQKFQVTNTVMLSYVVTIIKKDSVPKVTINSDGNALPGALLTGGLLMAGSNSPNATTLIFDVHKTVEGNSDGLYLSKGFYWLIVSPTKGNSISMDYISGTIAPDT